MHEGDLVLLRVLRFASTETKDLVIRPSVHPMVATFFIRPESTIDQDGFLLVNEALSQDSARLGIELDYVRELFEQFDNHRASGLWEAVSTTEADVHTADKMENTQTAQCLYTFGEVFCKFSG